MLAAVPRTGLVAMGGRADEADARPNRRFLTRTGPRIGERLPQCFAWLAGDFGAAPPTAVQETFALEKADRLSNRRPCHAELDCQLVQRRYCLIETPFSRFDLMAKMNDELDIDRRVAAEL